VMSAIGTTRTSGQCPLSRVKRTSVETLQCWVITQSGHERGWLTGKRSTQFLISI